MSTQIPENTALELPVVTQSPISLEGRYVIDDPEIEVVVPKGNGIAMHHVLNKPELEDYQLREQLVKREQTVNKDRVSTPENDETDANSAFYNSLTKRGYATKDTANDEGTIEPVTFREFDADACKHFTWEEKDEVISRMNESDFDVVDIDGNIIDDPLAGLTEFTGPMYIRQIIGGEDNPKFEPIIYTIEAPNREQRRTYLKDSFKIERKAEKKRMNLKTIFDINKGVGVCKTIFRGMRGAVIGGKPTEEAARAELLKQLDPMWMVGIVDAACSFFSTPAKN